MKNLLFLLFTLLIISCSSPNYYQVFKTKINNAIIENNIIVFEDDNCKVFYNLWAEGGDVGFSFYNKTAHDITLLLDNSFFVINGVAYEYFQNRTFAKSSRDMSEYIVGTFPNYYYSNHTLAKMIGPNSGSFSTSYIEKPHLKIPPMTRVNVHEYHVANSRYINCDLSKYPKKKTTNSIQFNQNNSPFEFYNLLTYSTQSDTLKFENKFYVNEITNFHSSQMFTSVDTSSCGTKLSLPVKAFKNVSPDKFYIRYTKAK